MCQSASVLERGTLAARAVELYNIRSDIGERDDLCMKNPAKRDELLNDLLAWQSATAATMPTTRNPGYVQR